MQRRSWLVGWALLTGSAGCYRFEPTTLEAVPEGSTIRAVLTPGHMIASSIGMASSPGT